MKKLLAIALTLLMILALPAFADEAQIQKTVYEGMGVVDVDFLRDVQYQNLTVVVQDASGVDCELVIWERDDDDLSFRVSNITPGQTYTFVVSGVRSGYSGDYGTVSGSFTVPENEQTAVKKVEYDFDDRELEVEFLNRVNLQGIDVKIRDAAGNLYDAQIREVEGDGFDAYVPGLEWGQTYTIEIRGIGEDGSAAVHEFVARDD